MFFPLVGLCTCCIREKSFAMSIIFLLMASPYCVYILSIYPKGMICPVYAGEVEVTPKKNTWKGVTGTSLLKL